jgi:hypothetical protein
MNHMLAFGARNEALAMTGDLDVALAALDSEAKRLTTQGLFLLTSFFIEPRGRFRRFCWSIARRVDFPELVPGFSPLRARRNPAKKGNWGEPRYTIRMMPACKSIIRSDLLARQSARSDFLPVLTKAINSDMRLLTAVPPEGWRLPPAPRGRSRGSPRKRGFKALRLNPLGPSLWLTSPMRSPRESYKHGDDERERIKDGRHVGLDFYDEFSCPVVE